jgi:putative protease
MPFIFRHAVWKLFEREWEKEDGIFSLAWDGFLVRNRESISFLTGTAGISRQKLRLDYNMYLMNRQTYLYWIEQGISKFTAPLELTKGELSVFPFLPQMELLFYGKLPLMVSAQCLCANMGGCVADDRTRQAQPIAFQDAKKRTFAAVNYCKYCYNVVYQENPLYLQEMAGEQKPLKIGGLRYSFTTESREQTEQILAGRLTERTQAGHFERGIE